MRTAVSRPALPLMMVLAMLLAVMFPAQAAEPTAAGLWQKIENGKPELYVLMIDHNGIIFRLSPSPYSFGCAASVDR